MISATYITHNKIVIYFSSQPFYVFAFVALLFFFMPSRGFTQPIATLEVELSRPTNGIAVPVEIDLDAITFAPDSVLNLLEITGGRAVPVAFQIEPGERRTLHWMAGAGRDGIAEGPGGADMGNARSHGGRDAEGRSGEVKKVVYQLVRRRAGETLPSYDSIRAIAADGELTIRNGDQSLLRYVYKTVYPPPGIDTAYKKSGFIHPLWSPHGQVLTRIHAPDHYHHYGIWDPWTHVLYKGDTVDFWNLKDRKGAVRFAQLASVVSGPVFASYETIHDHVAFKKGGGEEVAMHELQTVRVYRSPDPGDYYLFDLTIQLNCAGPDPVLLLAYRYGGLGWRATPEWNKDNSEVLTSEGKNRKEADGSKARWCIVQGAVGGDYAGAEMMSYPGNYNYPEPLRVWPDNINGRGDMYANFSPTKDVDWLLQPGRNYVLHYRWVVFNGHFSKEKAESAWQYFANPAKVTIKKD